MREIYWETTNTSPSAPPTFCGEQRSVPNLEKGGGRGGGVSEKKWEPRGTWSLGGLLCFLSKKIEK